MIRDKVNAVWSMCSCIPAHRQPIGVVVFGHFGFFRTEDRAVVPGLGDGWAVVSFPLLELLGTFLWHAFAVGSLLADELS